jgi:hypothetical protein
MKISIKFWYVLVITGIITSFPARAQDSEKGAPPMKTGPGALGVLQKSSYALGMWRRVLGSTHGVNGIMFIANGTMAEANQGGSWTEYKVSKVTVEMTYYTFQQGVAQSPGARWDFSLVDSSGHMQREILVAAGKYAWDEATPGGTAKPAMEAATYRLTQNWLTPHGLLWAALTPDGKGVVKGIQMSDEGGKTVLTIPVNGVPAEVTMDADNRPEKVETRLKHPILGDTPIEINYSGYRDIEIGYGIFFPEHIVEKIGGHTALDLTVTEFHTNAYSVFPVPTNLKPSLN